MHVIKINESATEMMSNGISPNPNILGDKFQQFNLRHQLFREHIAKESAEMMLPENVLIICDRSSYEQQVFVSNLLWEELLAEMGVTNEELMNSYDAVFHLVSTAIGAEYAFGMLSNKHRYHSLEESREQELKAQKLWKNHKNFQMFDNSIGFQEKIDKVSKSVIDFVKETYVF